MGSLEVNVRSDGKEDCCIIIITAESNMRQG